jgi:hypothetical protein
MELLESTSSFLNLLDTFSNIRSLGRHDFIILNSTG